MVLGAQVYPGGRPCGSLARRLDLGAKLFWSGKVDVLLVSGDGSAASHFEDRAMRDYLVAAGVPAEAILRDPHGYDTYDSCLRLRDVFGWEKVTLVSQGYHVPRAVAIATSLGVDAVGVGDYTGKGKAEPYVTGELREWAANLKKDWDLLRRRPPKQAG